MQKRQNELIAGLSIGTTNTAMIAAERTPGHADSVSLVGFGNASSRGVQNGVIMSLSDAVHSVRRAFDELTDITGIPPEMLTDVTVAFNAGEIHNESVSVELETEHSQKITNDTLRQIAERARKSLNTDSRKLAVHMFPTSCKLDGTHLEAQLTAAVVDTSCVNNVVACVKQAGLNVRGLVLKPLASSMGAVNNDEKEAGCMSVTLGGGTAGVVIYRDGSVSRVISIPSDIDIRCMPDDVIASRLQEICAAIRGECISIDSLKSIVLSGGVSLKDGVDRMLEEFLGLPVRRVEELPCLPLGLNNASFASLAGLMKYFADEGTDPLLLCRSENLNL